MEPLLTVEQSVTTGYADLGPNRVWCRKCGEVRAPSDFYRQTGRRGLRSSCKACTGDPRRRKHLRERYRLTPEAYEAHLVSQGGVCALCDKPDSRGRRLAVDHCHQTGRVRGLLCWECNTAIGKLGDSPERLRKVVDYLG